MYPRLLLLLAALLTFPLAAAAKPTLLSAKTDTCQQEQQAYTSIQKRYERGVLFRVVKCGHPASYVLGTMHSDSASLAPIYEDAMAVLPSLKTAVFEYVEDERTALIAQQYMMLPGTYPKSLSDMIPAKEYAQLADTLTARMKFPPQVVNRMRPWAAAVTLQYPPQTSDGISLDMRLQQRARAMGKRLAGLETPEEQLRIFDAVPFEQQITMLRDAIADIPHLDAYNEEFLGAYAGRDLRTLHRLAEDSFARTEDKGLREYLEQNLLLRRNRLMAERMQPHLRAGNTLIAVGALHLMGDDGILPLLEQEGWRIETVR